MIDARLAAMQNLIQKDIGNRGLTTDPHDNLLTACPNDFDAACRSVANTERARVVVVTGFYIAHAEPPCAETDGPLGAVFLARALVPLGIEVGLATDGYCVAALRVGLEACGLAERVHVFDLDGDLTACLNPTPTHLLALERVGPSYDDRCYSMRGRDLTAWTRPAYTLFETASITTIGIGDGGNEIGMGKIRRDVIRRNIPNGDQIACRVPTDHLIVCGVSNWGAYGLAAGVRLLRGVPHDAELFDAQRERTILETMVREGPLVDGKTGERAARVDGLSFDDYAAVLEQLR